MPEAFPARFRVVRFDRRGRGRSEPAKVEHSDIDDLASLMDALAIPRAVLLGCSSGGALAIDFALAHPGRVTGLVLEGAVVSGLPLSDQFWRRAMENLRPMFESQDLAKTIDLWVNDPWLTDARNTAAVAFRGLLGPARQQAFLEAIAPYDSIRFLPQLAPRPLLLRFARRDESIAPWDAQLSILAAGERATVEWYDAGHRLDDAARASREAWLLRVLAAP